MTTKLTKSVRRKIGNLIIELDGSGVYVRRLHHHSGIRVSLNELIAAADQVRAPRGWIPSPGETVAVLPNRHRAKVVRTIESAIELYVKIAYPRGTEKIVELGKLVPVDGVELVVKCERWPAVSDEKEVTLFDKAAT